MNIILKLTLALALSGPVAAQMQPYVVQGTFDDGGSFSGTFDYDPSGNSYVVVIVQVQGYPPVLANSIGIFDITTQGGTLGGLTQVYVPVEGCPTCQIGSGDGGSTPTELQVAYGVEFYNQLLVIDWSNALNGPHGGTQQPITGYESYANDVCGPPCTLTRQIISGFVAKIVTPQPVDPLLAENTRLRAAYASISAELQVAMAAYTAIAQKCRALTIEVNTLLAKLAGK
jgi:hypothetical protein